MKIRETLIFSRWLEKLRDHRAKIIIVNHIQRMQDDNMGNLKPVGDGVYEKKIDYGLGYRLYFCQLDDVWVLLLCGGDKSSQKDDIKNAKKIKEDCSERDN